MQYYFYGNQKNTYDTLILSGSLDLDSIYDHYVEPLGIVDNVAIVQAQNQGKRTPKKIIRECWDSYLPEILKLGVKTLLVSDIEYFKHINKDTKAETYLGVRCEIEGLSVFYLPNFRAMFYNPAGTQDKIDVALTSIRKHLNGTYVELGKHVIHNAGYIQKELDIKDVLDRLHLFPELTCDIETTGFKFYDDIIGTIGFAQDKHNGYVIDIWNNPRTLSFLRQFFEEYQGKLIYHNAPFDVTFLIYHLWMDNLGDQEGMLKGLEVMTRNFECTQIMAYLSLNSCAEIELGLKPLAQEFAGNYAEDVSDITAIPKADLRRYNLIDCLSTWFVKEKYEPIMDNDQQRPVFNLFMDWMVDVIQMQLTGMPLCMERVKEVSCIIQKDADNSLKVILKNKYVRELTDALEGEWVIKRNSELKVKRVTRDDADIEFNPNSANQLQRLLFDLIGLPILNTTKSGNPSTGRTTLKALVNHAEEPEVKELLTALVAYKVAAKLLEAFIPAFLDAPYCEALDHHFLFGNFRLGGTVSGRLSSNNVNLQQLPSGGKYGSLIKSCFQPPKGMLFVGLDFDSLEDKISGLTTKDENKLKVYTDGYCGHSLRAFAYFSEQMEGIENTVESINTIKVKYPELREDSKPATFSLTYGGYYKTLMKNLGWSYQKAFSVEENFKELYHVSIKFIRDKIEQASSDGYVTGAFGLRLRTPIIAGTVLGARATPFEAEAEARTAGNMLGQSYCMLNSRAANEFMVKTRASEYKNDIRLCAQIHDASYYLIPADAKILKYVNDNLVEAAYWQELPEIKHPEVKLGGTLGVFYPSWKFEHGVPKYASLDEIIKFGEEIANA